MRKNVKINKETGIVTWEEGNRIEVKKFSDWITDMQYQCHKEIVEIICAELNILMPL